VNTPRIETEPPASMVALTSRMNKHCLPNWMTHLKSVVIAALASAWLLTANAQQTAPQLVDTNLQVRAVVTNLNQPISLAFLKAQDFLVLEKATGKVLRYVNGVSNATVLDLAVNSASERGLLGIALHPCFPRDPGVYLYWTESTTGAE
jgi:glucose/arabinose dehydrogenase